MFKSIRYKLIILYFLLVFIAMLIVGVFITDQFEKYHLNIVKDNLTYTANNVVRTMIKDVDLIENKDDIQENLIKSTISLGYEISIIEGDSYNIIASTNLDFVDKNAMDVLEKSVILSSLNNRVTEKDIQSENTDSYRIKHMAFSYKEDQSDNLDYIIYGRASLDSVYRTLSNSTVILLRATVIALLVTIVLGYLMAGSITVPINQLTMKALKMAKGDFRQRVTVKSDDEIGQLGSMFNYLTEKLDTTLLEISSEKSKLNAIIKHMEDGLVAIDGKGQIIHYNPSFLSMLNLREKDLTDKSYDKIIDDYSKDLEYGAILQKSISNSSENIIFENNKKRILKASPALFRDEAGRISGAIVVFQDITESQRLEDMRREFVANVSHELKTPITTIKSYSETLLCGALEDKELSKNFVEVIENEADRMSSLVKDLLQLSHMDYEKVVWEMHHLDLREIVTDSVRKLEVHFQNKNQKLNMKISDEAVPIYADRGKIQQVIINLLTNAIKYTPENGNIRISAQVVDKNAIFQIQDSGIGIPKEDIKRIFERFYRVDKGRSRAQGGTGLGLSIAHNIIKQHKGSIKVSSELEKGSIFTVYFPVDNSVDIL
ncbi:sensory box histidine kinase yycg [Acetoanaerobium sticklandii]|uniref:histidine kinase n=1 Tax=Acetoanaerobium sticklandii (strain ATCC 12662 / DSM 519 / JCM 1433 / CCUG 9281 / NCIMB 10654 / HF) TaxID=499177 RepID=E3PVW8_ACESD|nr:ATP-binding protein [Acetoanaerobium sticklandii]CBH22671.1 sensory box histidine kinase yycg [Acetoanaerobium sticklandii]